MAYRKAKQAKKEGGARGIGRRLGAEGAPKTPLVGARGRAIAVSRVRVSITTHLSVRGKEISTVAPLHP